MRNTVLNRDMDTESSFLVTVNSLRRVKGGEDYGRFKFHRRLRCYLWMVCRNNVPIRILLKGKRVDIPILCPLCGVNVEHLRHVCLECRCGQGCWDELGSGFDTSQIL